MTAVYYLTAMLLLVSLGGGIVRVMRGPSSGDRMLAGQLSGTTVVAVLVLTGMAESDMRMLDVALVLALLAAVTIIAFVRRAWPGGPNE